MADLETEMIEIRVDFNRKAFFLFSLRDQKAIGLMFARYKHAWLAREWLSEEYANG
jgi:hypothetical protein